MIKAINSKKLFRLSLFLTAYVLLFVLLTGMVQAAAPKLGDKLGDVLYSDITAYIDGNAIPTSVIKGKTLVTVEDLARYGFDVAWNSKDKTLKVELNSGKQANPLAISANTGAVGAVKGQYVYTDIQTYLSGKIVESFAVNGKTMIDFELLKAYGTLDWNSKLKEIKLQTTPPTPKVGDVLGDVLYSDITAYINGQAIPTSVIKGKTLVTVEDLARYGFDVAWNNKDKTLKVELNKGKKFNPLTVSANSGAVGAIKGQYVYTEISTYLSGQIVESFAVGGKTMIDFELLKKFGSIGWNNQLKALTLTVENNAVDLISIAVNGSDTVPTTQLTITFDKAVSELRASDFTVTGATKGTLTGIGPVYYLTVSNITVKDGEEITVKVEKKDFTFTPASQKVAVFNPGYQFIDLRANGNYNIATTQLTLTFDRAVPNLRESDITVTGATRGTLTSNGSTYYLTISDITVSSGQNVTVSIYKSGYLFNPSSRQVAVYRPPVAFTLKANGSDTVTTNQLTLTFDRAVPGLNAAYDITVTGATKGTLTPTNNYNNNEYTLNISNITVSDRGYVTVQINKSGYEFSPQSPSVQVRVLPNVEVRNLTANGSYSSATTTLTFTLDKEISNLNSNDITITVPSGRSSNAVSKGSTLTRVPGTNPPQYTLPITFSSASNVSYPIKDGDKLSVTISKSGYNFNPNNREVVVYNPDTISYTVTPNNYTNTTAVTITFSAPVPSLNYNNDITIYNNGGSATKSSLSSGSNNNMTYTLYINTTVTGSITVSISKSGYTFNYSNSSVYVYASIPVTSITGMPTTATAGTPLNLTGTVNPSNATNRTITWTVANAGSTGATISGSTLNTTAAGTVRVRATISNGAANGGNYTQEFDITVTSSLQSFTIGYSTATGSVAVGDTIYLNVMTTNPSGTPFPNPVTDITWYITVIPEGSIDYSLSGNALTINSGSGTIIITAVTGGKSASNSITITI